MIVDLMLNKSSNAMIQTSRQEPDGTCGQSQSYSQENQYGRPHLKGLVCFHLHKLLLLAMIMPATMSIVILVPDMMIRLEEPLRHPPRLFTACGVEIIATGSVTEIDQEKRDEEDRDVDGCHDELDDIHVSIISHHFIPFISCLL